MCAEDCTDPFKDYLIASHQPLHNLKRSKCPKCKASRMYFCYTCYKYCEDINEQELPKVKLPFSVDIIKHPKELDGKSTAVHAALLASDDVRIYTYPVIPDYSAVKDELLLIFPGPDAQPLEYYGKPESSKSIKRPCTDRENSEVSSKQQKMDNGASVNGNIEEDETNSSEIKEILVPKTPSIKLKPTFKKLLMIDSTWNRVHCISTDERLEGIRSVELTEQSTLYWRRQYNSPDTFLATIEALHSFLKQYHELFIGPYQHEYDNLLYFFKYFHQMVRRNKTIKAKT